MKKTFSWDVNAEVSGKTEYPVRVVKLGNGYEQRQQLQLHAPPENWRAELTGELPLIRDVKDFLDEHGGVKSFYWVDPFGKQRKVIVDEVSSQSLGAGIWRLSWEFRGVWN